MEPIRPETLGGSDHGSPVKPQSTDSTSKEDDQERDGGDHGGIENGYVSDTESDSEQHREASTSSGASSPDLAKSRQATGKGSRRGGRSAHSVSFSKNKSRLTEKRVRYDGEEVTMVTLNTQTDWDWVESAETSGKVKVIVATEVKPESRDNTSRPRTELGASSAGYSRTETDYTPFSLQPNDEFGIPLLEMSSTSEDSSDEEAPKKKRQAPKVSLPSVGPPQILKYVRESELGDLAAEFTESEPLATSENLENLGDLPVDEDGNPVGMFNGPCEFCNQPIMPIPSLEKQQMKNPAELYCCEDYHEFIQFATSTALRMEQEAQKATKMISIKPHAHHGSKQARRAAKERAVERMRQREQARRQQEALGSQANFYSYLVLNRLKVKRSNFDDSQSANWKRRSNSRQMKTINYQLSSQRCLEEGWTLRPPSPLDAEDAETEIFVPEPLHPAMIASGNVRDRDLIQKYYPNGAKFLTIFPDGTGNVFYPTGLLAIVISSTSLGQYCYIVMDNTPEQHILAIFDPHGFGTLYYLNGNIRLYYDQMGGIELDVMGAKKKRWRWKDQETHVHAPPFQPICAGLNRNNSVRVMAQEAIALTFMANKRSCRFSVGARLKTSTKPEILSKQNMKLLRRDLMRHFELVAPQLLPKGREIDEHQLFIDERTARVENILSKVSMLLKFPKSPKVDKILPPLHVTSKMQRNEQMRKELSASVKGSARRESKAKTCY